MFVFPCDHGAFSDEASLGLFAPHKNTPLVLFLCCPALTFSAHSGTSCPRPLSAHWLLGKLLKGQTVPQYSAQMASWSPQSAAQFLSSPLMSSKNRGINAEKKPANRVASWRRTMVVSLSLTRLSVFLPLVSLQSSKQNCTYGVGASYYLAVSMTR